MLRLMCRAGARVSYQAVSADLKAYGAIEVEGRQINRVIDLVAPGMREDRKKERLSEQTKPVPRLSASADCTGVPMRKAELEEVRGKQPDGAPKTNEVKVGCIFTQHPAEGEEPFHDCDSTSYVATMRPAGEFGPRLRSEAFRRGMGLTAEIIFIKNGAAWIREMVRLTLPAAAAFDQGNRLGRYCLSKDMGKLPRKCLANLLDRPSRFIHLPLRSPSAELVRSREKSD